MSTLVQLYFYFKRATNTTNRATNKTNTTIQRARVQFPAEGPGVAFFATGPG